MVKAKSGALSVISAAACAIINKEEGTALSWTAPSHAPLTP